MRKMQCLWAHFMCSKDRKYFTPYFTVEDHRMQAGALLSIISLVGALRVKPSLMHRKCHWRSHWAYVSNKGRSVLVFQDRVSGCTSLNARSYTGLLYYVSVICNLGDTFWSFFVSMLGIGCYTRQTKSIHHFRPPSVMYMGAQVNYSAIEKSDD